MDDTNIVRLAPPKKKGILHLIFSRFFFVILLLLLQIVLYVAVFLWFRQYTYQYVLVITIFTVVMVIYLFASSIDYSAKLTWMFIISVIPFVGALLLWYTRMNFGSRKLKSKSNHLIAATKRAIPQPEGVREALEKKGGGTDDLCTYLCQDVCFPEIEADFQDTLSKCRMVTKESFRHEKKSYIILGTLFKFLAPLM